jgi:hypothetical protein
MIRPREYNVSALPAPLSGLCRRVLTHADDHPGDSVLLAAIRNNVVAAAH